MSFRFAINGFGRIGRCVARIAATRADAELVAIKRARAGGAGGAFVAV